MGRLSRGANERFVLVLLRTDSRSTPVQRLHNGTDMPSHLRVCDWRFESFAPTIDTIRKALRVVVMISRQLRLRYLRTQIIFWVVLEYLVYLHVPLFYSLQGLIWRERIEPVSRVKDCFPRLQYSLW